MKLLLHICCTPCLIYPLKRLKQKGFELAGLFYNPNIHPLKEYMTRKQALIDLKADAEIFYHEYNPAEFFQAVNLVEERPGRCPVCWYLRLKKTAQQAREKGFEYFSSTLLVSPYQDQEALQGIGNDIAGEIGVKFYYEDFRGGFREAHDQAKSRGVYCQKYCGCLYSEIERCSKQQKP